MIKFMNILYTKQKVKDLLTTNMNGKVDSRTFDSFVTVRIEDFKVLLLVCIINYRRLLDLQVTNESLTKRQCKGDVLIYDKLSIFYKIIYKVVSSQRLDVVLLAETL